MGKRLQVTPAERYGRLTVVKEVEPYKAINRIYRQVLCTCDCGKESIARVQNLRSGHTKTCGCSHISHGMYKKHGRSRTYKTWESMLERCLNPNCKCYDRYGGRGITVCDRWRDFEDFLADMGERPEGHSIDRINNALGYFPGNCRWATTKEQNRNMRTTRWLTFGGKTKCLGEWAEIMGINRGTLRTRIVQLGWSVAEALTRPVGHQTKH